MNVKEKQRSETITIKVYPETKEALQKYAKGQGRFLSGFVEGILTEWLESKMSHD